MLRHCTTGNYTSKSELSELLSISQKVVYSCNEAESPSVDPGVQRMYVFRAAQW